MPININTERQFSVVNTSSANCSNQLLTLSSASACLPKHNGHFGKIMRAVKCHLAEHKSVG